MPECFIGLVPDGELFDRLAAFIGNNASPAADPHVTVKAQPGLSDVSVWLDVVTDWARTYGAVDVPLGEPRFFGEEILYLSVGGGAVPRLHAALLDVLSGAGVTERFEYEGEAFVPHLTLSATWLGRRVEELAELAREARRTFEPTTFTARTLSVFRTTDGVTYERWTDLPLEGGRL